MFDERPLQKTIADDVVPLLEGIASLLPDMVDEDLLAWLRKVSDGTPESVTTLKLLANAMPKESPKVAKKVA